MGRYPISTDPGDGPGYSYTDYRGNSGYSGPSGYSGESNISGYSGISGVSGYSGISGRSGYSGISGVSGFSGISGVSGYSGISGVSGYSGISGRSGYSGSDAQQSGYSGRSGYSGISGVSGYSGVGYSAAGTCTLSAGASTVVSTAAATTGAHIFLFPTNSAAANLPAVYISSISNGVSFTISHSAAQSNETFNYLIVA